MPPIPKPYFQENQSQTIDVELAAEARNRYPFFFFRPLAHSTDKANPQAFADRLVRVCKEHLGHRMGATYRDTILRCIRGVEEKGVNDIADVNRKKKDLIRV
jgi:hypothetical protein